MIVIFSLTLISSCGTSISCDVTGAGFSLACLLLTLPVSVLNVLSAKFASYAETSLSLIRFIMIIAFKSSLVGVPKAWCIRLAFLTFSFWDSTSILNFLQLRSAFALLLCFFWVLISLLCWKNQNHWFCWFQLTYKSIPRNLVWEVRK